MAQLELVTPTEHFKEKLSVASRELNFHLSPDVEFYLVTLLCKFVNPTEALTLDRPLALQLKDAHESNNEARQKHLKHLGDTALYLAGYFQDFFNKKTYDISYYISMGSNAYLKLSCEKNGTIERLYKELSDGFVRLVEVVAAISDEASTDKDVNILATYDRWTRTGSDRLRKLLEREGISPIDVNMNRVQ